MHRPTEQLPLWAHLGILSQPSPLKSPQFASKMYQFHTYVLLAIRLLLVCQRLPENPLNLVIRNRIENVKCLHFIMHQVKIGLHVFIVGIPIYIGINVLHVGSNFKNPSTPIRHLTYFPITSSSTQCCMPVGVCVCMCCRGNTYSRQRIKHVFD